MRDLKKDTFDELVVVKRSGQRVSFNGYKIAIVIKKAYDYVYENYDESEVNKIYENVLSYLEKNYSDRKTINVEDIQDIIESEMKKVSEDVYRAFSEYRQKRAESRKVFKIKQQHKFAKAMEKIADSDFLKADTSYSPTEILLQCGKTVLNEYAKAYIIDNKFLRAHEEGRIFIHDMDSFSLGKLTHFHPNLGNLLDSENAFEDIFEHLIGLKSEIDGEINIPSIDYLLEPWMLKRFKELFKGVLTDYLSLYGFGEFINTKKLEGQIDKLDDIEFKIEKFEVSQSSIAIRNIFNTAYEDSISKLSLLVKKGINRLLSRLSKSMGQYGFSVGFGLNKSGLGSIVNRVVLEYIESALEDDRISFIFNLDSTLNPYLQKVEDLISRGKEVSLAFTNNQNGIEYFANGVRIYDNYNDDEPSSVGRMVVGTTSINMARLALECEGSSKSVFMKKFDEVLELVKNELLLTFESIGNKNRDNYNFLFTGNVQGDERLLSGQKVRKVIKNSILNIGLVGLKEMASIMREDPEEEYEFAIDILKHANKKVEEFSASTKLNFMLCEPYEDSARKEFLAIDKAIYGSKKINANRDEYDLLSNLKEIKENVDKMSKVELFLKGGSVLECEIPKNGNIAKIHKAVENYQKSDIQFVRFVRKG